MRKVNELKAGAILSYVNLGISSIIPLLYTPVMLRMLGQAEYGLYSLSQSVISYLGLLTLGLGSTIMVYLMKYRASGDKVMFERVLGLFIIIYSILACAVCVIGIGIVFVSDNFFAKGLNVNEIERLNILILIMSFGTAISFLNGVCSSPINCYEKYIFLRVQNTVCTIVTPIFNIIILYVGFASIGMALVGVALNVFTFAINVWYCAKHLDVHPKFRNLPTELLKPIFSFTAFVFVGIIADLLYWATDKVLIGAMIGTTAVAVYNIGSTFNIMMQNMISAISGVFGPRVNMYVAEKRPMSELSELMIRVGRIQYILISLMVSGFVVFGRAFIQLWAGIGYEEAYAVALLTMIPHVIPHIQNIAFSTICAQNRHQFRSVLYVILAVLNVIGTYFAIPVMGVTGAALCTFVVFIIGQGFIMNWFYYKKIGLDIPMFWKNIIKLSFVPVLMIIISIILRRYVFDFKRPIIFVSGIVVYTCVYCVLSWCVNMNNYEKNLVMGILKRLKLQKG